MKTLQQFVTPAALALLLTCPASAEWENLNPGAGGRIQDIVLDPNTPGRAYYLSDMEGVSRTDNYGESWQYTSQDGSYLDTLTVAIEPGNPDRVYLGTINGLEISDDAGGNWQRVGNIDDPIHQIAVNPQNPDEVYAIVSSKMRWYLFPTKHLSNPFGKRILYISRDRGSSWNAVAFEPGQGRRDTFSIDLDPTDPTTIYLAGLAGIFKSTDSGRTWNQLPSPENTGDAWGADLSPDGKVLYAAFQIPAEGGRIKRHTGTGQPAAVATRIFATPTDAIRWQQVEGLPAKHAHGENGKIKQFWMPEVDPQSTADEHRLLTSSIADRSGLWQITAQWKGGKLIHSRWERIFHYENFGREKSGDFDHGWEQYATRPLAWQFTPESWGERGIWTTGDQTLFSTSLETKDPFQHWQSLYTQFVREIDGVRFYRTRGVQCTFVFEGTGEGNYVAQANGDNAVKESYDGGQSWAVGIVKPRSNAVTIVRTVKPMIVLAHISSGYGGSSAAGSLYAKRLEHVSPKDKWDEVGGGPSQAGGLPDTLYNQIITDPHNPKRVFIGTIDRGLYVIDDIEAFVDSKGRKSKARPISGEGVLPEPGPLKVSDKSQGMLIDPHTPGVMWVGDDHRLWRGHEQSRGKWKWEVVREDVATIAAWDMAGRTALAVVPIDHGRNERIEFSLDVGQTWPHAINFDKDIKPLRQQSWYQPKDYALRAMSPVGHDHTLYVAYGDRTKNRPYGYFAIDLKSDGSIDRPRDITGDMPLPLPVESRIIDDGNGDRPALYVGTWGNGLWRLRLE